MLETCSVRRAMRWAKRRHAGQVRSVTVDAQGSICEDLDNVKPWYILVLFAPASLESGGHATPALAPDGRVWARAAKDAHVPSAIEPGTYDALVQDTRPSNARRALVALVAAVILAASVLAPWRDPSARRGHYEGKSEEEIAADLAADVAWYAMEISVAGRMSVPAGQRAIEARIENVEANHCDQKVRIWEAGNDDDILFESGALTPGDYLQWVELTHPLEPGRHTLVVEFQGYEQEASLVSDTGVPLGHDTFGAACAAEVTLEVTSA